MTKNTPWGTLDKALEGGVPAGDMVIFGNTPKVNMDETPYSYFPTQVPVYHDTVACLNVEGATITIHPGGLVATFPDRTGAIPVSRLEAIQMMSLKHIQELRGDFDGNSVRMNTIVNYVSEMSKELKTFLDSPMPKERRKQRKPMYQKKVKKELKLHPLLAGFTGKQKC